MTAGNNHPERIHHLTFQTQLLIISPESSANNKEDERKRDFERLYKQFLEEIKRERNESPSPREIGRDRHYIAYANGIVHDKNTGLEWYAGPDKDTNWNEAKRWVASLNVDGGGWRMPTRNELKSFYQKGAGRRNMTALLETTGWDVWSGETRDSSSAWGFDFYYGSDSWSNRYLSADIRAFAVRSRR